MNIRQQVRVIAHQLGGKIVEDDEVVAIDAPPFHFWREGNVHQLVCFDYPDAVARMQHGVERCHDRYCDICAETRVLRLV